MLWSLCELRLRSTGSKPVKWIQGAIAIIVDIYTIIIYCRSCQTSNLAQRVCG